WGECSAEQQCFAVFDSAAQGTEQGKVIVTQVEAEMSGFSSNDIASGTLTTSLENGQIFSPWAYVAGAAAVLGGIALAAGGGGVQGADLPVQPPIQIRNLKSRLNDWQTRRSKQLEMLKQRQKSFLIK
ncbi:hypothetical protein P9090_12545, partial [Gallibacterium anatis]